MSTKRMRERVPNACVVGVARLEGRSLAFNKRSIDMSAKCNLLESATEGDFVLGVLFDVPADEKPALDKAEALGKGYDELAVKVVDAEGNSTDAVTYVATETDDQLQPYPWYKRHVIEGAKEAGFDSTYIAAIEAVITIEDPDVERSIRELSIYNGADRFTGLA